MAVLSGIVRMDRRPCWVNGRKGVFHQWIEKEDTFLKCNLHINKINLEKIHEEYANTGIPPCGCELDTVKNTYAIIEFEDGKVELIPPTTITFLDSNFDAYSWDLEPKGD